MLKNCRFVTTCKAHKWHVKGRGYNKKLCIISMALDVPKRIFAVLYVSFMGLTHCYKTTVF